MPPNANQRQHPTPFDATEPTGFTGSAEREASFRPYVVLPPARPEFELSGTQHELELKMQRAAELALCGWHEGRHDGKQGGRQGGRKEGRRDGRQAGRKEGRREGRQEGRQEGSLLPLAAFLTEVTSAWTYGWKKDPRSAMRPRESEERTAAERRAKEQSLAGVFRCHQDPVVDCEGRQRHVHARVHHLLPAGTR